MANQTITHIVLFKYRSNITWTDFESHFSSFSSLKDRCLRNGKPYMLSMRMGKNRSWEPHSKGMTHGFVLEFASQDDLDYYLTQDEVHAEFSKNAKPFVEDSVVVDITDGLLFGAAAKHPLLKREGSYAGSCHCGELKWAAKLDKAEHVHCHCGTCQKLGGGPYSCNQIIARQDLTILQGEPKVYTYKGASGKDDAMPDKLIVRTLLFEGGSQMPATGEIFAEGRLRWVRDLRDSMDTPEGKLDTLPQRSRKSTLCRLASYLADKVKNEDLQSAYVPRDPCLKYMAMRSIAPPFSSTPSSTIMAERRPITIKTPFDLSLGFERTHVLVTGANGFIGRAVVHAFLAAGASVTACDLSPRHDFDTSDPKIQVVAADITKDIDEIFRKAEARFGPVETVVALASYDASVLTWTQSICDADVEEFRRVMEVNVTGTFQTVQRWLKGIRTAAESKETRDGLKNVGGVIVGSDAGVSGSRALPAYATGKSGVQ
ncbi:hypothetical protein PRZ48_010574 [Zasmidium cellare]|uniref:Stress-response A/B barrel domain-containing protein n=1 Tax=Zasmidium cellare TaxID=395010 RepID=A0ABR0E908_ZASCE|nr:hypothetical protein PRZ48_010574 [Zasmidium cellare]